MINLEITQTENGDAAFVRGLTDTGRMLQSTVIGVEFAGSRIVAIADAVALALRAKRNGHAVRVNGQVQ